MQLELFYSQTCPYCRKVLNFLESNNISVELTDRDESAQTRNRLVELAGKTQVPCLVIDGKPMHESDDIIQWLDENKDKI